MSPDLSGRWRACAGLLVLLFAPVLALAAPWFEDGRPTPEARQAVSLLSAAADHGLDPGDYGAQALGDLLARAQQQALPVAAQSSAEPSLTRLFEHFLADLHVGRVDPQAVEQRYRAAGGERFEPSKALQRALQQKNLALAVQEAEPAHPQYAALRRALAQYRRIATEGGWEHPLPALPKRTRGQPKLESGQDWSGVVALARRLRFLGDLGSEPVTGPRYDGPLVDAVRRFQMRHGLTADATLGPSTLAALEVSPTARVRQLELSLERLRWTPHARQGRMIEVSLPEFALRAYQVRDGVVQQELEMKVIVGKAPQHPTPVFDQDLRFVEFSPYWNVPLSIARTETIPKLRKDPDHFADQGFEFVRRDGTVEVGLEDSHLDAVLSGQMRLRQRPGSRNALGSVKFVFPNQDNIYLHHTPSVGLFERDRRDFSHGCIRVEQPRDLAEFVLRGMAGWDRARIDAAMEKGSSQTLRLSESVPVVLTYGTSRVQGEQIYFYRDLYGLDRVLDRALRQRASHRFPLLP
jgi:L,D-transpeptidase YcbB